MPARKSSEVDGEPSVTREITEVIDESEPSSEAAEGDSESDAKSEIAGGGSEPRPLDNAAEGGGDVVEVGSESNTTIEVVEVTDERRDEAHSQSGKPEPASQQHHHHNDEDSAATISSMRAERPTGLEPSEQVSDSVGLTNPEHSDRSQSNITTPGGPTGVLHIYIYEWLRNQP